MKRILMKRLFIAFVILSLVLLQACTDSEHKHDSADSTTTAGRQTQPVKYTCPMHPSVVSDKPGACPICGMTLVKRVVEAVVSKDEMTTLKEISLSASQRIVANVATVPVERRTMAKTIEAVGVVDYAEPMQSRVTARFRGRIEKLYVNSTGEVVHKGQALFELHSPDLESAEQDLILAAAAQDDQSKLLQDASRMRLREHFGVTEQQINEIAHSAAPHAVLTFYAPNEGTVIAKTVQEGEYVSEGSLLYQLADLRRVWINLDVYEKDLSAVKLGQQVAITVDAYPGETFYGKVIFIEPVINSETRTVRVRTEFANGQSKLKPQMYVNARIENPLKNILVVPTTSVLSTGRRTVVWIEKEANRFEQRTVLVGAKFNSYTEITSGLAEGDVVVVSGGFLIDSESQLQEPVEAKGNRHD
jgi:membrane fusion protein, copper/silver efflux system